MFTAIYGSIFVVAWVFFYVILATNVEKMSKEEQVIILCLSGILSLIWPVSITGVFVLTIGKKLVKMINKMGISNGRT